MAKLALKKAATDVTVYLFAQDSSKTTGEGLTGLAYNTASLTAYYVRPLGSATAITLATQTVTGAHSDGGFVEVDATNMPGVYRLDLPDAVCATGVPSALVMLKGATNLAPVLLEIQLLTNDPNDIATETTAAAILADTGTDGVKIASAQTVATVTNLTNLPTMPNDWVTAAGVKADAVAEIADAILDEVVVGSYTMRQLLTVMSAALAGKLSGGGTTTLTFRGIDDASNVIVATVDANGNRSAVTINV